MTETEAIFNGLAKELRRTLQLVRLTITPGPVWVPHGVYWNLQGISSRVAKLLLVINNEGQFITHRSAVRPVNMVSMCFTETRTYELADPNFPNNFIADIHKIIGNHIDWDIERPGIMDDIKHG